MSFRRVLRVTVAVLVALGVQVTHGAPSRSLQTLRAMQCCRASCHHTGNAGAAERCCAVGHGDADSAAKTPSPSLRPPAFSSFETLVPAGVPARPATVAAILATAGPPRGRAAPVFLTKLALLI